MPLVPHSAKGLTRLLVDSDLDPLAPTLRLHISEITPGTSSHPPHTHGGDEAVHLLAGELTLRLGEEHVLLQAGDAVVFDPQQLHGLTNTGTTPARYLVILRA